jgi:transcriptional regulator with XRE-family HTH domain
MSNKSERPRLDLGPTGRAVAANLNRVRTARGISLRDLAKRINGVKLPADALTNIENERRRVNADELTALAVALGVNVSALILPPTDEHTATVEITGAGNVPASRAWDWADGHHPITLNPNGDDETEQAHFELHARPPERRLLLAGVNRLGARELFDRLSGPELRRLLQQHDKDPDGASLDLRPHQEEELQRAGQEG